MHNTHIAMMAQGVSVAAIGNWNERRLLHQTMTDLQQSLHKRLCPIDIRVTQCRAEQDIQEHGLSARGTQLEQAPQNRRHCFNQ
jgi:hypothetical protein